MTFCPYPPQPNLHLSDSDIKVGTYRYTLVHKYQYMFEDRRTYYNVKKMFKDAVSKTMT